MSTNQPTVRTGDAEQQRAVLPAVDVYEDQSGITLLADMPGVPKERLELKVEADTLSIEGQVVQATPEGWRRCTPRCACRATAARSRSAASSTRRRSTPA